MRKILVIAGMLLFVLTGCKKEEIVVFNNQITPDLSNPVIQKLTNTFWYNPAAIPQWESTENIPNPSETVAAVLYTMAWKGLLLNRDGTSVMLFVPPMFKSNIIFCKGTWDVSPDEENTIIMTTKTPVSNVTLKIKVTQMETKDDVSAISLSMDFGNRLITVDLNNNVPDMVETSKEAFDYSWLERTVVKTEPLKESDFLGTWATAAFDGSYYTNAPVESMTRSVYVEDILTQSPVLFNGLEFVFGEKGQAKIVYSSYFTNLFDYRNKELTADQKFYSNANWSIKGNKLTVTSDEVIFYSIAEGLFGISVHDPDLTVLRTDTYVPFRIRPKRFYTFEIISNEAKGNWCRVTANDGIFYIFLYKRDAPSDNLLHVRDYKKK